MKKNFSTGIIISYIASGICMIMGFYKMFAYENSEYSFSETTNAYVGGDAYNFIINAGLSTAWFTLAGVCAIIGLTFVIANYLQKDVSVEDPNISEIEQEFNQ